MGHLARGTPPLPARGSRFPSQWQSAGEITPSKIFKKTGGNIKMLHSRGVQVAMAMGPWGGVPVVSSVAPWPRVAAVG